MKGTFSFKQARFMILKPSVKMMIVGLQVFNLALRMQKDDQSAQHQCNPSINPA
jgi:hypothetical protein